MPRRRALPPPHLPHPRLTSPTPRTPLTSHSRPTPYLPVALPAGGGRHPAGRRRLQVHPQVQARGAAQGPHGGQSATQARPYPHVQPHVPSLQSQVSQACNPMCPACSPCTPGAQGGRREAEAAQAGGPARGGGGHVETSRPEASANSPFSTPRQRQFKLRAASNLGQCRPIGRYVLTGRPYRPCFPSRWRRSTSRRT